MQNDTISANRSRQFYSKGFIVVDLEKTAKYRKLMKVLEDIYEGNTKKGFEMVTTDRFSGAKDLRPHPQTYDDVFIDILFDQKIPHILKKDLGFNLILGMMKVRVQLPAKKEYTNSHRDTYIYGNVVKGVTPPAINVNFYPCFDEEPEDQVNIWPATHIKMPPHIIFDKIREWFVPKVTLKTSNESMALFDTSAFHSVCNTKNSKGSLRIIYNFFRENQLGIKELNGFEDLAEKYKKRLIKEGLY